MKKHEILNLVMVLALVFSFQGNVKAEENKTEGIIPIPMSEEAPAVLGEKVEDAEDVVEEATEEELDDNVEAAGEDSDMVAEAGDVKI